MIPRPYQQAAGDCLDAWLATRDDSPVIVVPTGGGKTIIFASIIQRYLRTWPGTRILVLAHVRELVEQNARKLAEVWPEAPLGVYSAGLGRRDTRAAVIFAGVQSVYRRAAELGHFDLVFVDEAHRIPAKGDGQYLTLLAGLRAINPLLRVVGFTATPYRLGVGSVCGPDKILNGIAYEVGVGQLIAQGYLSPLVSRGSKARADLSAVHVRQGEYVEAELERASLAGDLVERTAAELLRLAAGRRAGIVFCVSKAHAARVAAELAAAGEACAVVDADTPAAERSAAIAAFKAGRLRWLVNINVLSEGFDAPHVDCVAMLRPTKSAGLYYQVVGRGLRLHPGKADCLVLDFAGNIMAHGPIDAIRPPRERGQGSGDAPCRECPACGLIQPAGNRACSECGHVFPVREPHKAEAADAAILKQPPAWLEVTSVRYSRHEPRDAGKRPTLRADYRCGMQRFSEWVCFDHEPGSYPRQRAEAWWGARAQSVAAPPESVDAAVVRSDALDAPARILVDSNDKYPRILDHDFTRQEATAA